MTSKALEGIRVIDCTLWLAGPWASMMLADLGAEVIKIEDPVHGDPSRGFAVMWGKDIGLGPGRTAVYEAANRNKKAITLDLMKPESKDVMKRLVAESDIFVQNMTPGCADNLGIGYDYLSTINPRLIYGTASNNGPKGPDANRRGMDPTAAARSGLMDTLTPPGHTPFYAGGFGDMMAGVMLSYGLLAALAARDRIGLGQRVDTSVIGSLVWLQNLIINVYYMGKSPDIIRFDRAAMPNPMHQIYLCKDDKWIYLNLLQPDVFWTRFCESIGTPELEHFPLFETTEKRAINARSLTSILDGIFAQKTSAEWLEIFHSYPDFQCEPIQRIQDLATDPQIVENDYIIDVEYPFLGKTLKAAGFPISLSQTPATIENVAPEHGQNTEEVLLDVCGYSWDEVAELKSKQVI